MDISIVIPLLNEEESLSELYEWIEKWLESGLCSNFICTIKMQGETGNAKENRNLADFETPKRFAKIPGSKVIHLYHNKHELTWILLATQDIV